MNNISSSRSYNMSRIRARDTQPEILIRKGLHARGYRFRLHDKKLPGKPDMVLSRYKTVILIQGCFWHVHECYLFRWPATRREFWEQKLNQNQQRDIRNKSLLKQSGWRVIEIWECALKGRHKRELSEVLDSIESILRSSLSWVAIESKLNTAMKKSIF